MARRVAGTGPLHAAPPLGDDGSRDGHDGETHGALLDGTEVRPEHDGYDGYDAGGAAGTSPLRVEDPVHPPAAPVGEVPADEVPADEPPWLLDALSDDDLDRVGDARMHPDDLAALHALPTTRAEALALEQPPWQEHEPWDAGPGRHGGEPGWYGAGDGGRRLVGTAGGISVWDDDDRRARGEHGERAAALAPAPAGTGVLGRRWVQLVVCAVLAFVVGAAVALVVTDQQVGAARAEAQRQSEVAATAQADLVRERAARRAAEDDPAAAPVPAPPSPGPEPTGEPAPPTATPEPAPGTRSAPEATSAPADGRSPVAEAPAPTENAGPPPPGPSPSALAPTGRDARSVVPAPPSDDGAAGAAPQPGTSTGPSGPTAGGDPCGPPPEGAVGAGGDSPVTCP